MAPITKKIAWLILVCIFSSLQSRACDCSHITFMDKYVQSDFVARIQIVKNYPNQGASLSYRSNIAIKQLFKGDPVKSILIEGSSDGKRRTSCDIYFKEGTDMLVYARRLDSGQYSFNSCSGYCVLNKTRPATEMREIEMLEFLDKNNITLTDKTFYVANLHNKLETLTTTNISKSFAIYEITFTSDLQVDIVKTVTGFTPKLDSELTSILKKVRWRSDRILIDGQKNSVPPGSKLLLGFYYYPPERNHPGFISEYDL